MNTPTTRQPAGPVADHQCLEQRFRALVRRQQDLIARCPEAIALVRQGKHIFCNTAYAGLFGCRDGEALAGTAVAALVRNEDRDLLGRLLALSLPEKDRITVTGHASRGGERLTMTCRPCAMFADDCVEISVSRAPGNAGYARLKQDMARQDMMTRFDTPAYFNARLESAIAAAMRNKAGSVLMVVRIEQFRNLRDSLGTVATSQVLEAIADFLQQAISKSFTATRLAEDEFALLLFNCTAAESKGLAGYIRSKVNEALTGTSGCLARLDMAIGMVVLNRYALDAEAMLGRARMNSGRTAASGQAEIDSTALVQDALAARRLELVFQPLVGLNPDGLERYDVLVRLRDASGQIWLPETFLAAANIGNLAEEIDRRVLSMILGRPNLLAHNRTLFLHVSSNTLANLTLLPWLDQRLGRNRHLGGHLVVQVSEQDLYNNREQVQAFAHCLRRLGIRLCLAGFGCVLDPLPVINTLKPDLVKLDDCLVRDLFYSRGQQEKLRQLVMALHHHRVQVAVTRIEDMEILPLLWELGVDLVQGFCLQPPDTSLHFAFPAEEELVI